MATNAFSPHWATLSTTKSPSFLPDPQISVLPPNHSPFNMALPCASERPFYKDSDEEPHVTPFHQLPRACEHLEAVSSKECHEGNSLPGHPIFSIVCTPDQICWTSHQLHCFNKPFRLNSQCCFPHFLENGYPIYM